ncbi:MAG: hypothetical protein KAU21_16550, partial [Gammaproteobacteria bacterium]|nr:hypothetical protein [Gammaproteobacteria bacterium]
MSAFTLCLFTFSASALIFLDSSGENGNGNFDVEDLYGGNSPTVGVVLMHGRCSEPADGPVVNELRTSLHTAGYTTISIKNPLANGSCNFNDYEANIATVMPEVYARVRTAINYLQANGVTDIVLAGFSLGSRFTAAHVARGQIDELPIQAYIGIGMYANHSDPLNHSYTLDEFTIPALDIYGDHDTNAVTTAASRISSYNSGIGPSYTQIVFDCDAALSTNDCHKLVGLKGSDTAELETTTLNWLKCYAPLGTADC